MSTARTGVCARGVFAHLGASGQGGISGSHGEKELTVSSTLAGARYVPCDDPGGHAGRALFAGNIRQFGFTPSYQQPLCSALPACSPGL